MTAHDDPGQAGDRQEWRAEASGPRSAALRDNSGMIVTGDLHGARRPPLPSPALVEVPAGLLGLPRRPAAWFTGRERALEQLAAALEAGARAGVVVSRVGLGGVGKSELALQYAFARRLDYDLVWWIDADSPAQIEAGLAALARAVAAGVDSVAAGQASPEEAAAWALAWLAGRTGWLLVLDNVEEPAHVEPYLARLTRGQVLITTRRDVGWRQLGITPLWLETLARPASVRLLGDLIGPPDAANAVALDELAAELGDLPLALTQAGTYITVTPRCTLAGYLHLLKQTPARMYAAAPAGTDAERVVAKAWELSRTRVTELDPLAGRLLNLLACYAPDHLPCLVLAGADRDEQTVNEALALLASYSLITITTRPAAGPADMPNDVGQESVSVHRLVQAVIWSGLGDDQRARLRHQAAELISVTLPGRPHASAWWPLYRQLLPHARAVLPYEPAAWQDLLDYLQASGDAATGLDIQQRIHRHTLNQHGPEHPATLGTQHNLARWTGRAGDAAGARDQLAKVLPVQERVLGAEHPDTLTTRSNLAHWMGQAGDVAGARDRFAEVLRVRERVLGAEHPDTLATRHNLAYCTGEAGDVAGARDQLAEVLPVRERVLGAEHPDTLATRHNLAHCTGQAGDVAGARDRFAEVLPVRERVLGAEHPEVLFTRHNLAHWTGRAGDAAGARDQLAEVLPVRERVLGAEHPDTLATRHNL
ncbi:FxSxx-COOH system tetratricopeptide repeat protein, partial [Nonomuraea sp. NPDC050540]|uniref:FxSxx-COOH system tetratricopeptide repeat protein n=1 Tax=Nonomuraea sp. NPDC050540 TaxID=3364367 RepID=UPI0037B18FE1